MIMINELNEATKEEDQSNEPTKPNKYKKDIKRNSENPIERSIERMTKKH
ncbi:8332_t:CDS:2 [Gigaspora margarita]|uniref:8332_t:CDS:1 n=1 Tax=Gigaspora margarita TaxID=4874 RepID=A0ABN7U414_GIGMA|nr:8332_t:CDS:2 [Gigaspora margarita]